MKKSLMILTMVLVCTMASVITVQAQSKTSFGFKAGFGMATLTGDDVVGVKSLSTFGGGFILNFKSSDRFSIRSEAYYVIKGTKEDASGTAAEKVKLGYIEIPVLFVFSLSSSSSTGPVIFAGPSLGILMSAKVEGEDIKDFVKNSDFGITVGAGINLSSGLSFDARYTKGLVNIDDEPDASSVMNGIFMVNISYFFQKGE